MSKTKPSTFSGFTPLPIAYSSSTTHILYARAHTPSKKSSPANKKKLPTFPSGRTLFLVNVPPDATDREITQFFKPAGLVERVIFEGESEDGLEGNEEDRLESESEDEEEPESESGDDGSDEEHPRKKRKTTKGKEPKPVAPRVTPLPAPLLRTLRKTGRNAHVVFLESSSVERALVPPSKPRPWPSDKTVPSGLAHYKALYAALRPPLDVVKDHTDSYMELFEFEQEQKRHKSKYKKGEAIVDEDGFTLVTRGGAYGRTVGGGVGVSSKKFQKATRGGGTGKRSRKNKKEPKEKESFYAFQIHEKKRKELVDLKARWEEDKAKVEKLKDSRKFKPY